MATTLPARPGTAPCDQGTHTGRALERTRFYPRQLLGPEDLTQDQLYFREKHKRHNRLLHGWGIVCGACVRRGAGDCEVIIEPGYVLGPHGDEIVIDREVTIDVCRLGTGEQDGCCESATDPWCTDVRASCPTGRVYLAVRYEECAARPVRHAGGGCGCGCDEDACEYSRLRDSYVVKVLRALPAPYTTPLRQPPITAIYPCQQRTARGCPQCPPEPWVILADIVMRDDCTVAMVDCFAHRRQVVTFAEFFWACAPRVGTGIGLQPVAPAGKVALAHVMSAIGGTTALVDVDAALSTEPPQATVAMRRSDGTSVTVPAFFAVEAGETLGDLLNREGDRELYDPEAGASVTLRALFADADVPHTERVRNAATALAFLAGRTLRTPAERAGHGDEAAGPVADDRPAPHDHVEGLPDWLRVQPGARTVRLRGLLDERALERLGDQPSRSAATLPAESLQGLGGSSHLGERVRGMTVADVAAMGEDEFVVLVAAGARGRQKKEVEAQARATWERARRVVDLVEGNEG